MWTLWAYLAGETTSGPASSRQMMSRRLDSGKPQHYPLTLFADIHVGGGDEAMIWTLIAATFTTAVGVATLLIRRNKHNLGTVSARWIAEHMES
jgi:hypothetical protein